MLAILKLLNSYPEHKKMWEVNKWSKTCLVPKSFRICHSGYFIGKKPTTTTTNNKTQTKPENLTHTPTKTSTKSLPLKFTEELFAKQYDLS